MKSIPSSLVAEYFAKLAGGKIGEFILEQQVAILELEQYRKSWYEWSEKTDWVQETAEPKELGMHRADILRKRIEDLEKEVLLLKLK
jgi:hypothetical protein